MTTPHSYLPPLSLDNKLCCHCNLHANAAIHIPPSVDIPDNSSDTSDDLASEADDSDDEGVPAHILAEFEETTRILDNLREFADQALKTLPNPAFTHPLKYAMHLMKTGFNTLSAPPPSPPSCTSPLPCCECNGKEQRLYVLQDYVDNLLTKIPPARSFMDAGMQTPPPPLPPPARVCVDAGMQTTPPPAPPARVFADAGSQTPSPARPTPTPSPSPPPTPARTPSRSASPPPRSPSTRGDFEKVLARLTLLRQEVSPPPSPPPTPRAASPAPRAAGKAAHFHLTLTVPHGTRSFTLDLVEHAPTENNKLYEEFSARPTTANARARRGQSRGRPSASPVRRRQHSM